LVVSTFTSDRESSPARGQRNNSSGMQF
jgi:hypothetical protein